MAMSNPLLRLALLIFLFAACVLALPAPYLTSDCTPTLDTKATTLISGTEMIDWGSNYNNGGTGSLLQGLTCFSKKNKKCAGVDRHWALTAAITFCKRADGMVFDMKNQNTSVKMTYAYWPASMTPTNSAAAKEQA